MAPKARQELARERVRLKNDYGVDRWGEPFRDRPVARIHTTARSHKRHADSRRMLTSAQYGTYHGDRTLRAQGFDPEPAQPRLAPFDRPADNCTVRIDPRKGPSVPAAVHQSIGPETRLAMGTPLTASTRTSRRTRRPHTSAKTTTVPDFVRAELCSASFQPSWYSTAVTLELESGKTDTALPKNAKTDLRFHPAGSRGLAPETGRYPKELKADGFSCFMTNERNSSLTTGWSHELRGQRY